MFKSTRLCFMLLLLAGNSGTVQCQSPAGIDSAQTDVDRLQGENAALQARIKDLEAMHRLQAENVALQTHIRELEAQNQKVEAKQSFASPDAVPQGWASYPHPNPKPMDWKAKCALALMLIGPICGMAKVIDMILTEKRAQDRYMAAMMQAQDPDGPCKGSLECEEWKKKQREKNKDD
eukprot:gnl/TRDRNA2_/TRDRNA2_186680_c0_seq1.p1 gnl/TRDRNA2_/TRDRNA2_186680_c0~~gnl/TRDRNA2_/TRDRNA2_186680_c0_seq1.p1  ORF type:complete len:178 (+),score=42.60 gnl/TRDRNA2_/TRDRNA2_186680_c0_seq1:66-599(+)